jgi:uroporphyrinogen-III decarboxylase
MATEKKWSDLTWEEKREERFKRWLSPDVKFSSQEAEKGYRERVTRFIKAIKLEEPDRVPVMLPVGFYPAYYAGFNLKRVMYDYEALKQAWLKFLHDFRDMDIFSGPGLVLPARALDIIGHKLHKWPGNGLPDDSSSYQFLEGEYMKEDDYDKLIDDSSDFLLRTFMPQEAVAFKPLAKLPHLTPFIGIPVGYLSFFGDPEIQAALKTMMAAGEEVLKWQEVVNEVSEAAFEAGYPSLAFAMCGPPFDTLADMFRGTRGMIMDMYRQPEKVHEAMERIIPVLVKEALLQADAFDCPILMMPLHKGDQTFMSPKQFETFYWPTFKKVMICLIEEGLVPMPFAEGNYEPRLEIIRDMPRSSVAWYFEHMDMAKAKKVLGDTACIVGNVPVTVLCTGTPREVKECCRQLIETCAEGGGYILTGSASINKGNPANLHAMMAAAREYGTYK